MKQILIVGKEVATNLIWIESLKKSGYSMEIASSEKEIMPALQHTTYDVILLEDGVVQEEKELVKKMKQKDHTPIIFITTKEKIVRKLELLRLGVEDYLIKPLYQDEVLARIEVLLYEEEQRRKKEWIQFKDIFLNQKKFEVIVNQKKLILTKREFEILNLLMCYPEDVFSKQRIYEIIWKEEFLEDENVIQVHISNLRQKLAKANRKEEYIKTIWGIGYTMKKG